MDFRPSSAESGIFSLSLLSARARVSLFVPQHNGSKETHLFFHLNATAANLI
jgi:hypothetical protein